MHADHERPFILLHQMGKVGSTAIAEALKAHPAIEPWQVQNTHTLNADNHAHKCWFFGRAGREKPPELGTGEYILREVIPSDRGIKIISPFRDPVGRNISSFFHSLEFYMPERGRHEAIPFEEILGSFYAKMRHEVCPKWYAEELRQPFGIDVYAEPYLHEQGHRVYVSSRAEALVFPYNTPNDRKSRIVGDFLGIDGVEIGRTNEASDRADAGLYREFVAGVVIEPAYLDWMYSTPFATTFFTPAQLGAFREKWSTRQTDEAAFRRAG